MRTILMIVAMFAAVLYVLPAQAGPLERSDRVDVDVSLNATPAPEVENLIVPPPQEFREGRRRLGLFERLRARGKFRKQLWGMRVATLKRVKRGQCSTVE